MANRRRELVISVVVLVLIFAVGGYFLWHGSLISTGARVPRGKGQIAYLRSYPNSDGYWDAFLLDTANNRSIQLTLNQRLDDAEWTPDGETLQLVYKDGTFAQLNVTSGELAPLAVFGHISPDGKRVLFDDNPGWKTFSAEANVITTNRDGGDRKILAKGDDPVWSPDGTRIAFESRQPGDADVEIYVMDADGSHARRVVAHPGQDNDPIWSPDGKSIFFTTIPSDQPYAPGADAASFIVTLSTGELQSVFDDKVYYAPFNTAWSPDSGTLAFTSDVGSFECSFLVASKQNACSDRKVGSLAFAPQDHVLAYQKDPGSTICLVAPGQQDRCFPETNSGDYTYITRLMWRP